MEKVRKRKRSGKRRKRIKKIKIAQKTKNPQFFPAQIIGFKSSIFDQKIF